MKTSHSLALAALGALALGSQSMAQLVVTVTPAGGGNTLWTFSGSATYTESAAGLEFRATTGWAEDDSTEWKGNGNSGNYVASGTYNNQHSLLVSGTNPVITVNGTPYNIGGVIVDHDGSGDDFGVTIAGAATVPVPANATVAFSGSAVFAVDYAKLNPGVYSFGNISHAVGGTDTGIGTLPLNMTVVPEPETWAMVTGMSLCGVGAFLRRRKASA